MSERIHYLDYAKGIGIVLVVYGHVARGLVNARLPLDRGLHELVDSVIYSFHMPLFFFISGILYHGSAQRTNASRLLLGKVQIIVYPYVLWSLIQGFIEIALSGSTNNATTVSDVLSLLWQPRAQFWFLYTLFFIFAAAAVVYRCVDGIRNVVVLLGAAILYFIPIPQDSLYIAKSFGHWFVYFAAGVSSVALLQHCQQRQMHLFAISAVAFFASQVWLHGSLGHPEAGHGFPAADLMLACIGIVFMVSISQLLAAWGRVSWLAYIGRHSMEIYLVHIIAGSGTRVVLQRIAGVDDPTTHLLLGTMFGVGLPLLVAEVSRRTGLEWLFSPPIRLVGSR